MKNRFHSALSEVKAEEQLKRNTIAFLQKKVYQRQKRAAFRQFAVAFASLAIILFAGVFSYNLYFTESAYMDIDVNPSIELTFNRFDRVIGVYAYNEDGQKVLDEVDLRHKSYEGALAALIDKMTELGYIQDTGQFTATLQKKDGDVGKEELDALKAYIDSVLRADDRIIEQTIFSVDSATKSHAHEQNLTPAKYLAILELQALDPTATFDSCRDHSISEIEQQIHDHMNNGEHGEKNDGDHSDNGNQNGDSSEDKEMRHHSENGKSQSPIIIPENSNGEHGDRKDEHVHD